MKILIAILFYFVSSSECFRVLGIFPLQGKSHFTAGVTLMKILAGKGHDVTMVSPFKDENSIKNFKMIVLAHEPDSHNVDFFSFNLHPFLQTYIYSSMGPSLVNSTYSHPVFRKFLESREKFDVIIIEQFYSEGLRYLAHHFDAPIILYSALGANSWTNPSVANPAPPSYIPDLVLPYTGQMTFFQRMESATLYVINEIIRNFISLPGHDKVVKQHFPGAPDISEYYQNASIVLLNSDSSVSDPVPKVPGMIDIGGFHIKKPKPLPEDLQKILDNAKDGVIYFSLGSNIKSANMPKTTLAILLKVFSGLKETILWKWEDDNLPGKPKNVITRKWLPQNDVFAHKNVKLFITHGGMFSTMEAVYHGLPCLAFPIFGDQTMNAQRATANGYARWMKFSEITEERLKYELGELLTNPQYSKNAKKRSEIMHDKPLSPADTLTYWVEYVVRHQGANHLRVAALKLTWYQYLLLDVALFVSGCVILSIIFVKLLINYFWKKSSPKLKKS